MRISRGLAVLLAAFLLLVLTVKNSNGCSCMFSHPQQTFCDSDFVIVGKVKGRILQENEIAYNIKVNRIFKLINDDLTERLQNGPFYTPNLETLCGVSLEIGQTYVIGGSFSENQPRLSLCDLKIRLSEVTRRQRRGFKRLYENGCSCEVRYTSFQRKGTALSKANGTVCIWEGSPGPMFCQEKHGVCAPNNGRCGWIPSKPYNTCIKEYYENLTRPRSL